MKLKVLAFIALSIFTTSSFAGLLIDPYAGVGSSKQAFEVDGLAAADADSSTSSTIVGARLGWTFLLLSAGIDYQMASGEDAEEETMKATNTSLFVGVDLPILLRAWGEYFLSSNIDSDTIDSVDDFAFKDGYSVGIGFTGLPFVSLNLEVEALNYTFESSGLDGTYTNASTIFSVSLPINL